MELGHLYAMIGLGIMVGLSGAGSAIGTSIGCASVVGMLKKRSELFGNAMVLAALPSSQGLYGLVGFILYNGYLANPEVKMTEHHGAVVLGAGIALGIASIVSAIQQGRVCANGISAMGSGHDVFGKTIILAAFPEFYSILSLVAAILMMQLL